MEVPIRVLHVFAVLNRGGAETMIMNLYRNAIRDKVQFDFIVHTNEKGAYEDEIEALGGKIYRVPKYVGTNHFQYVKAWIEFFKVNREYKIIHSHVRSTASIYLSIAKRYGLTTIIHSHGMTSGKGIKSTLKNILQLRLKYVADYRFACSMQAGKWLFGKEEFIVLKNSIEIEKFVFSNETRDRIRKDFKIENNFVIGHVGRFNFEKNHDFIIDIFDEVLKINSDSILLLVGDGDLKNKIEYKVKMLGIENSVIFTGVRSDVNEIFQAMDVFLFPSRFEGLGIVAIEAQCSGLIAFISNSIPKDAIVVNELVKVFSLNLEAKRWAEEILKYQNYERHDKSKNVINEGYDIKETSSWITKFYMNICEKEG